VKKLLFCVCLLAVVLFGGDKLLASDKVKAVAHVSTQSVTQAESSFKSNKSATATQNFASDMQAAINNYPALDASAALIDLDTGQTYNAGKTGTLFKAASTAKVLAAVDYMHEVEQGNATLDEEIDGTSAQQLIEKMLEVSDNDAWADINDFLGAQQQKYAQSIGLASFTGGDYNTITASDQAKLLAQLAEGKLINSAERTTLYTYMENADGTNLITAAAPSGATVYHKYGELWGYLNDTAIINFNVHHFALVIFTNNEDGTADDYNDQVALIQSVSAAVFADYD